MTKLLLRLSSFALLLAVLFTACTEDITDNPIIDTDEPPTTSVSYATSLVNPGEQFVVTLTATAGTSPLNTLTIYEDGVKLDLSRLSFADGSAANPLLLSGTDKEGFTKDITITAHDADIRTYEFEVIDEDNGLATSSIDITVNAEPPLFTLVDTGDGIQDVDPNSLILVKMVATKGGGDLTSIGVYEDGVLITDLERLRFLDASTQFETNPHPIVGDAAAGFEGDLYIRTHAEGTKTYTVEITDANGKVASSAVDVEVFSGTNLSATLTGVLLNQAGPAGTGGLDLDTGEGKGSSDAAAEIRDQGIDTEEVDAENWRQQISGVNGTIIRTPDYSSQPEGFGFDNITTVEQIIAGYDTGFALPNADGTVSGKVSIGDEFIAVKDGRYYFLKVTDIVVTTNDNGDYYEFAIKY